MVIRCSASFISDKNECCPLIFLPGFRVFQSFLYFQQFGEHGPYSNLCMWARITLEVQKLSSGLFHSYHIEDQSLKSNMQAERNFRIPVCHCSCFTSSPCPIQSYYLCYIEYVTKYCRVHCELAMFNVNAVAEIVNWYVTTSWILFVLFTFMITWKNFSWKHCIKLQSESKDDDQYWALHVSPAHFMK